MSHVHEDSIITQALETISRNLTVRQFITSALDSRNRGITEDQFYSLNLIDATDVTEEELTNATEGVIGYCKDNGCYAALPPFEEGAFIDRTERRYFHWKVIEVLEDSYRMVVEHYPLLVIDSDTTGKHIGTDFTKIPRYCWYLSGRVTMRVKVLSDGEHQALLSHHPDFVDRASKLCGSNAQKRDELLQKLSDRLKAAGYVGGVIEDYEYFYEHDLIKIRKKGKYFDANGNIINGAWIKDVIDSTLEHASDRGLQSLLYVSCGPFIEMFTYLNYLLSNKSTSTSMHRKVSAIYAPNTETPELRKERHFGKVTIVSEKKPRAVNTENIQRIYTTVAWQRRSHLRHLKSGKVVPVKSAICNRHNLEGAVAPQVVYKV